MKRKLLMTLCGVLSGFAWAFADDVNYTGTVVSKTGEPIMGATVTVTGTTVSTMTDMDGKFSLIVCFSRDILSFLTVISHVFV